MTEPREPGRPEGQGWTDQEVDLMISVILRSGLLAATGVVLLGACLHFIVPEGLPPPNWHHFSGEAEQLRTIPGIISAALRGQGRAVMQLGILLLLATPILRVVFAAYAFGRQYDKTYVVICVVVFAGLMLGIFGGGAGG